MLWNIGYASFWTFDFFHTSSVSFSPVSAQTFKGQIPFKTVSTLLDEDQVESFIPHSPPPGDLKWRIKGLGCECIRSGIRWVAFSDWMRIVFLSVIMILLIVIFLQADEFSSSMSLCLVLSRFVLRYFASNMSPIIKSSNAEVGQWLTFYNK